MVWDLTCGFVKADFTVWYMNAFVSNKTVAIATNESSNVAFNPSALCWRVPDQMTILRVIFK